MPITDGQKLSVRAISHQKMPITDDLSLATGLFPLVSSEKPTDDHDKATVIT